MLSKTPLEKILSASYMKDFSCLGSACPFTCCGGWDIAIDKKSFLLVREALAQRTSNLEALLSQNPAYTRPEFYGKLHLKNCACPLMDKDHLCSLQKRGGEMALPLSCATFPRVNNAINGVLLQSARLSCPEIARLVLLDELGFELIPQPPDSQSANPDHPLELANEFDHRENNSLSQYFFEIQTFLIKILKNRRLSIEERLSFLLLLMRHLTKMPQVPLQKDIEALFSKLQTLIDISQHEKSTLKDLDFQHDFLVGNIVSEHLKVLKNLNTPHRFAKIFNTLTLSEAFSLDDFEKALGTLYPKFSKEAPFLFENFLVNWVVGEIFPFKTQSIHYESVRLVVNFSLLRFLILANSMDKGRIDINESVETLFLYSRVFGNTELPKLKSSFSNNRDEVFDLLFILNHV